MQRMIDKERLIWNLSNSKCKCDRSCDVREYLDYETVNAERGWLINQLKNVVKILMRLKLQEYLQLGMKMSIKISANFFDQFELYYVVCS